MLIKNNRISRRVFARITAKASAAMAIMPVVASETSLQSVLVRLQDSKLPESEKTTLLTENAAAVMSAVPWGGIAVELGKGVLGFIGGEIFKKVIGFPTMEGVVDNAVAELKAYISIELEARFLDECNRKVQGLYSLLHQYYNSPEISEHRLNAIDTESNELLFLLAGRGAASFPIFILAVTLRVIALYTRSQRYNSDGELKNIEELIGISGVSGKSLMEELRGKVTRETSEIYQIRIDPILSISLGSNNVPSISVRGYVAIFGYKLAGQEVVVRSATQPTREAAAENARSIAQKQRDAVAEQNRALISSLEASFLNPGATTIDIWEQIRKKVANK